MLLVRTSLIILTMLLLGLPSASAADLCNTADFPKLFGSTNQDSSFYQFDAHLEKNAVCGAGTTNDGALFGSGSLSAKPVIICYQGFPNYPYKWGKFANENSIVFAGIQFSSNGELLIVHSSGTDDSIVAVFKTEDGQLKSSRKFPESNGFNPIARNMLIGNDEHAYISKQRFVSTCSTCNNNRLFKFEATSSTSGLVWAKETISSFVIPMGLEFGENENFIYALTGTQTNTYLQQIQASDGTVPWIYSFTSTNNINDGTWALAFKEFSSTSMIVAAVGCLPTDELKFAQVNLSNGNFQSDNVFKSTLRVSIKALLIKDANNAQALLYGQFGIIDRMTAIALLDFSAKTLNYKTILPQFSSDAIITIGKFVSESTFYIGGTEKTVGLKASPLMNAFISKNQGIISSSDSSISCQSENIGSLTETILALDSNMQTRTPQYSDITISYTTTYYQLALSLGNIVQTALTDMTFCQRPDPTTYNLYSITPFTQSTTTFTSQIGIAKSFTISPFQTTKICGQDQIWTYSLEDFSGTFLSINSSTGKLTVAANSVIGTYDFKIKGKLQNQQKYSQEFTLQINANQLPNFQTSLIDQSVAVFSTNTYQLPAIIDPEGITVTTSFTYDSLFPGLPTYITYDSATNKMEFKTPRYIDVGSHTISISLSDGVNLAPYILKLDVTNSPPVFSPPPSTTFDLPINSEMIFNFKDPEGQGVTTKTYIGAVLQTPTFLTYTSTELKIKTSSFADLGVKSFDVKLSDGGGAESKYSFAVTFTNSAPYFESPLIDQFAKMNQVVNYILPNIKDSEGNIVTISQDCPFCTLSSSSPYVLHIQATQFSQVKVNTVTITLDDGNQQINVPLMITVTNQAPRFETSPTDFTIKLNQDLPLPLPKMIDDEGNTINLNIFPNLPFIVQTGLDIRVNPTSISQVGKHSLSITLSDDEPKVSAPYIFNVIVTNSAPYFASAPTDQTVAVYQVVNYKLPTIIDDENNFAKVTISPQLSFVTINSAQLTIQPVLTSDVANYQFKIILEDEEPKYSSYTINIFVIQNTAPYFVKDPVYDFKVKVGEKFSYSLPSYIDAEGNIVVISMEPVHDFVQIQGDAILINPTQESEVGKYPINLKLSDLQPLFTEYPITITIEPIQYPVPLTKIQELVNIGPPTFDKPIEAINLQIDTPFTYSLPNIINPDDDAFEIEIDLQDCLMFTKYDSISNSLSFNLKSQYTRARPFIIKIVIIDKNPIWPKSSNYTLLVYTPAPISMLQEEKNSIPNLNNSISNIKNITTETARLKLLRASKDGMLQGRIISSDQDAATMLAKQLNQSTDLKLYLRQYGGKQTEINFEIDNSTVDAKAGGYFTIKMFLEDPATVSIDKVKIMRYLNQFQELDSVMLRVIKEINYTSSLHILTLQKHSQSQVQVPQQLSIKMNYLKQQIGPAVKSIQIAVLPISITLSLILQIFLNFVWGLLNDLTLLMSLAMVAVPVPGLTQTFMSIILKFIYLDLLQTDLWLADSFHLNQDADDEQSLSPYFEESGFQSKSILKNLGSTLIYLIALLVAYLILSIVSLFDFISNKLTKVSSKMKSILMWNFGIRFIIQQFQPLMLSSLINFYDFYANEASDLSFANAAFSFACIAGIQAIIITLTKVLNKSNVEYADFKQKYGILTEGHRTTNIISKYWTILILLKWTILSIVLVVLRDHSEFQIFTLLGLTLTSQILILQGKPLQVPRENHISLFNDLMAQIYLYFLLILTLVNEIDSTGESEEETLKMVLQTREMIGVGLLTVVFFTFAVNIGKFFFQLYQELLQLWKKRKLLKQNDSVVKMLPTSPPLMTRNNKTSLSISLAESESFYRGVNNQYQGPIKMRQSLRRQPPDQNPNQHALHDRTHLALSQDQESSFKF